MKLLICVLNKTEKLNELIESMSELGIRGATVLESQGMARILGSQNIPVFAGFRHLLAGDRPFNYTIFSVIQDEELAQRTVDAIRQHLLPGTSKQSHGIAFTVPVDSFVKFDD